MLRASIFLLSPLLSVGLVVAFGWSALVACFAIALLTLVGSNAGAQNVGDAVKPSGLPSWLGKAQAQNM